MIFLNFKGNLQTRLSNFAFNMLIAVVDIFDHDF